MEYILNGDNRWTLWISRECGWIVCFSNSEAYVNCVTSFVRKPFRSSRSQFTKIHFFNRSKTAEGFIGISFSDASQLV